MKQDNQAKALTDVSEAALIHELQRRQTETPQIRSERLVAVFGLGDQPAVTRRLYARLERGSACHGPAYSKIVRQVGLSARSAREPAKYFACAVVRRLRECGFE